MTLHGLPRRNRGWEWFELVLSWFFFAACAWDFGNHRWGWAVLELVLGIASTWAWLIERDKPLR